MKRIPVVVATVSVFLVAYAVFAYIEVGNARRIDYCNGMIGLDYGAAVDGAYIYKQLPTFKTIGKCGGYCMTRDCSGTCPPKNWTCE